MKMGMLAGLWLPGPASRRRVDICAEIRSGLWGLFWMSCRGAWRDCSLVVSLVVILVFTLVVLDPIAESVRLMGYWWYYIRWSCADRLG